MSLLAYFTDTTSQSEQDAELAASKERFQAALARRVADGTITPEETAQQQAYVSSVTNESENAAAAAGFAEGAKEGFNNVLNAPGKAVGAVGDSLSQLVGGVLKNIPWWVYLVAAAALFVWLGGLTIIRGSLARR